MGQETLQDNLKSIRNVAIIAHVDHGKTTLVDQLLYQSGQFRSEDLDKLAGGQHNLIMDTDDLERERGITILSKNCAVRYIAKDEETYRINLIDTPGHADFGGEVERVLSMADGVLLVVDAFEGPMPQTRFVLEKAMKLGLRPIVVINKVDRIDSRPDDVVSEVFDLLVDLGADDETLDFPVIYASAKNGWACDSLENRKDHMKDLYEKIIEVVPSPRVQETDKPFQMLVTTVEYSEYVGRIAIGRVAAGTIHAKDKVAVISRDGTQKIQTIAQLFLFDGLSRQEVDEVSAGHICAMVGLDPIDISDTIADRENPIQLAGTPIDEPTLHMMFAVNDSPFAGQEGKFLTSRQLGERLTKELRSNVALRVEPGASIEQYRVSGRGLMHLGILIETMRREGFEMSVGKPEVVMREIDGVIHEPIEQLVIDVPEDHQSSVMSLLGDRRAEMIKMGQKSETSNFVHLEFTIPSRALIGLRSRMLTATQGQAIMHHTLLRYEPARGEVGKRTAGVLISNENGGVTAYALDALYDRGFFFVKPSDKVYEGQLVGENCKAGDLVVNCVKGKKLSNVRASGKDDTAQVRPAREMSLENCLEYIEEDELVEVTPSSIRLRKRILKEANRRRAERQAKG